MAKNECRTPVSAASLSRCDLEGINQWPPKKPLVERAGLRGVATPIGSVVQALYEIHDRGVRGVRGVGKPASFFRKWGARLCVDSRFNSDP